MRRQLYANLQLLQSQLQDLSFFFYFGGTGVGTQGLTLAKALYHLRHSGSLKICLFNIFYLSSYLLLPQL
jgi:hypothetical protein